MFAVKDLESTKNLAAVLVIPLFTAAYISDGALEAIRDPVLDWLRNHSSSVVRVCGWAFWLLVVGGIVTFVLCAIDKCIVWLHVRVGGVYVMAWFGFTCISAGLFILSLALPSLPKSPLNPLWHLALLCYGFTLVDRSFGKVKNGL